MSDIAQWLESLNLGKYVETFAENDIDLDVLPHLTDEHLKEIGISLGDRVRLLKAIKEFESTRIGSSDVLPESLSETSIIPTPEAERRQLTVMFCDLVGSTALAERFDPEDLGEIVRTYQDSCAGIVSRYEGYIARYMGDGILAYFGYPHAHEDDAERALRAGLEITKTIPKLEPHPGLSLAVRVGVATGPVVVGETIGEGASKEQMVVGETPNLAARLQSVAEPNTMVISPTTRKLAAEHFDYVALGAHELKGISEPVEAWLVLHLRESSEVSPATVPQGMLVGRDQELSLLNERWVTAVGGEGQVVYLSGEPGIGKTRLVEALREKVGRDEAIQVMIRCSSYHTSSAFYPMQVHLERVIGRTADDGPAETFAKIERLLADYRFADETTTLLFAGLLGISPPAWTKPLQMPPEQQKEQTRAAIMAWMVEDAERQPLLLVWEDLHWADPSTVELVGSIIDHTPTVPVLVLLVARPDFNPPWGTRSHLTPMTLTRLGTEPVEAIAHGVTKGVTLPGELLTQIVQRADGVPLFIEEMTKSIIESGVLRRINHHYELVEALSEITIPITLHDSLMARLDRLQKAKSLAQIAAVIGRHFAYPLLHSVAHIDEATLQEQLRELIDAELIYPKGVPPQATYVFKNALIQDVAYESLLHRRREELHGAIAEAIETDKGERVGEQAGVLAHHYARSAHPIKAIGYALQAGDESVRLHARAEATMHYSRALTIAQELSDSVEAQRNQIDAMVKLASVGSTREDSARDTQNLLQAQSMAEALGDECRLAQVLYWRSRLFYVSGDMRTALDYSEQGLAIADRISDETLAAWPVNLIGRISFLQGDYPRASQLLARNAEQMKELGNIVEEATIWGFAAMTSAYMGELEEALSYAERGIRLARESQDPFAQAAAVYYRGFVRAVHGNWPTAIADYEEAGRTADEAGDAFRSYLIKSGAGHCHTMTGNPAQGRVLNEDALAFAEEIGTTFLLGYLKAKHANCLIVQGEPEKAEKLSREALDLPNIEAHSKAYALHSLACALNAQYPELVQPTKRAIEEAIAHDRAVHYRPELARVYLSYARMLQGWGQIEKAKEKLNEATAMFQEMGMEWDLDQADQLCSSWVE